MAALRAPCASASASLRVKSATAWSKRSAVLSTRALSAAFSARMSRTTMASRATSFNTWICSGGVIGAA